MYSIEEARISGPKANYNIPEVAALEFGREDIRRAVQAEAEAVEAQQIDKLRNVLPRAWRKLTGAAGDRSRAQSVELPAQPEATR